jgi:hypothetical protein
MPMEGTMKATSLWARILFPLGVACILVGSLDPLEGSLLIVPGIGVLALEAFLTRSRQVRLLTAAFVLAAVGVIAMFVLSSFGGIRFGAGSGGLAPWWGLLILPYPIGWVAGIVGAWRGMTEHRSTTGRDTHPAT